MNDKENLLGDIHEIMLTCMKDDLQNPDKRSPQLYNAIIKELERNGIDCIPKAGDDGGNALSKLLESTRKSMKEDYGVSIN